MGLRSRDCGAQSRRVISFSSISFWPFWRCVWGHCPAEKCNPPQQSQIPLCWAVSDYPKSPHTAQHPSSPQSQQVFPHHSSPYSPIPRCSHPQTSQFLVPPSQSAHPLLSSTPLLPI